jgi:integrase/recombinase XerD
MALEIYKRRHGCDIEARIQKGEIKVPKQVSLFSFLQQYAHCNCAWWIRGVTDYGKTFPAQSLKVYSKAAAEEEARRLNRPDAIGRPRVSLAVAVEDWMTELRLAETNRGTMESYQNSIGKLTKFCAAKRVQWLADIDPRVINQMRAEWAEQKRAKSTRLNYLATLGVFFNWAVRQEMIPSSPLKKISGLSKVTDMEKRGKTLPLDPDGGDANYEKFLDGIHPFLASGNRRTRRGGLSTRPESYRALCELMYETGLRVCDAVQIRVDDIQINERCGVYTTQQQKTKNTEDGGWVTVFIPLELAHRLKALPKITGPYVFLDNRVVDPHDYISYEVNQKMRQIAESVGLTGIRPHRFRDTFAVRMLNSGRSYDEVAILLGHQNPKTTIKYYSPWVKSRENALMEKLFPAKPIRLVKKVS